MSSLRSLERQQGQGTPGNTVAIQGIRPQNPFVSCNKILYPLKEHWLGKKNPKGMHAYNPSTPE
jgi:hypothetical protein